MIGGSDYESNIIIAVLVIITIVLVLWFNRDIFLGSDRDEHGCIATAGYVWDDSAQKCVRPWEEQPTGGKSTGGKSTGGKSIGGAKDSHGCYTAAGYVWSDKYQKCVRPWEEK